MGDLCGFLRGEAEAPGSAVQDVGERLGAVPGQPQPEQPAAIPHGEGSWVLLAAISPRLINRRSPH